MAQQTEPATTMIGLDIGDRVSHYCEIAQDGERRAEGRVPTSADALTAHFGARPRTTIVLEVGTHSPWVSRLLEGLGHAVLVANPSRVRLIAAGQRKQDRTDAEALARLGRIDPELLAPIRHRGEAAQADLARIRARENLVQARTQLVNHVRSVVKSHGGRLPRSSTTRAFAHRTADHIPPQLQPILTPQLETIALLSDQIAAMDRAIEQLCRTRYSETQALRQVAGVGPLTALTFVLTIEDPTRFAKSRDVPAYLGLVPRLRSSGQRQPQLGISKAGDRLLRRLLVGAAHYILGPFGPDTDLRRWGLRHAPPGHRAAKKRALVAVARKLAVLLHRLWVTGEAYAPLRAPAAAAH